MKYILNLFTPETWKAFQMNGARISGFPISMKTRAENIAQPGDIFLCYMVRLSRWCGMLRIIDGPFIDNSPVFRVNDDPYVVRFRVEPLAVLNDASMIPLSDPSVWGNLGLTKSIDLAAPGLGWAYKAKLAASLVAIPSDDGEYLSQLILQQTQSPRSYPLDADDAKRLAEKIPTANTARGAREVEIPEAVDDEVPPLTQVVAAEERLSIKMQALICKVGAMMKYDLWVPRNDRARVLCETPPEYHPSFIDRLPLNYNDATLKTIEQIDVLWLKRRSIVRAFEVEGTTAVYSGLLRMADLLALQPDLNIRVHIVAPDERGDKVMRELRRPVFLYLEGGPLSDSCSLITYSGLRELADQHHLEYMNSNIVSEYELRVEDSSQ